MYSRAYVEITNLCNMHCSFCHGHSRAPRQMTREEFSLVLDRLEGYTKYVYYHLMGEPLTHPLLPEFLTLATRRGFRSVITTNGTLLEKRGDAVLEAGLHKLSISLHSFEQTDEARWLEYLRRCGDFACKAAAQGTVTVLRLWNRGYDEGRNRIALEFLRSHIAGAWQENSRGIRIRDNLFLEWGDRFQWPDLNAPVQGDRVRCYGLGDHFGILCDGTVVPCCLDSEGAVDLGNVFRQELGEILDSPRAKAIREGFARCAAAEELCRRCGYAQRFVR